MTRWAAFIYPFQMLPNFGVIRRPETNACQTPVSDIVCFKKMPVPDAYGAGCRQ
jgi:hypothetical protein